MRHFEQEFTNRPIFSPESPHIILDQASDQEGDPTHTTRKKADLFAATDQSEEDDEFGADFYFAQSPKFDEQSQIIDTTATLEL